MSKENIFLKVARDNGREYITPEDVGELIEQGDIPLEIIRRDLLSIIGKQVPLWIEDASLAAFIASRD